MTGLAAGSVTPQDIRETASACRRTLQPLADLDWDAPAGDLEWSCRATLGHMLSALVFYAVNLTSDIAAGLGVGVDPPREVCARVLGRLFPWAPPDKDPWAILRWANGRAPLGERPRLAPDWVAHPAPLHEWDGVDPNASS